ncbi:hypothetical protein ACJX0J_019476, partial [Zea mays]
LLQKKMSSDGFILTQGVIHGKVRFIMGKPTYLLGSTILFSMLEDLTTLYIYNIFSFIDIRMLDINSQHQNMTHQKLVGYMGYINKYELVGYIEIDVPFGKLVSDFPYYDEAYAISNPNMILLGRYNLHNCDVVPLISCVGYLLLSLLFGQAMELHIKIINLLAYREIDGNMPMGIFTRTGWKILNKLDNMKKEYTWFMEQSKLKNNIIFIHLFLDIYMLAGQKQQQRRYPQVDHEDGQIIVVTIWNDDLDKEENVSNPISKEPSELLTVHMFIFIFYEILEFSYTYDGDSYFIYVKHISISNYNISIWQVASRRLLLHSNPLFIYYSPLIPLGAVIWPKNNEHLIWGPQDSCNTLNLLAYIQQTWAQNKKQYTKHKNMVQNGPIIILGIFLQFI